MTTSLRRSSQNFHFSSTACKLFIHALEKSHCTRGTLEPALHVLCFSLVTLGPKLQFKAQFSIECSPTTNKLKTSLLLRFQQI